VGNGTQGQEEFGQLQCQDELSRPSWNVHFDKEQDGQVVLFKKLLPMALSLSDFSVFLDYSQSFRSYINVFDPL
jgi:hypothetical protein